MCSNHTGRTISYRIRVCEDFPCKLFFYTRYNENNRWSANIFGFAEMLLVYGHIYILIRHLLFLVSDDVSDECFIKIRRGQYTGNDFVL